MSIVRYADDFVILAGKMKDVFVRRIEQELETRFGLVVNREKTKVLNGKSQRGYRLKYAETYYGEYQRLGLITLTKRRYYR